MNPGKVPIQELQSTSGGSKMQSLIQTYEYYLTNDKRRDGT